MTAAPLACAAAILVAVHDFHTGDAKTPPEQAAHEMRVQRALDLLTKLNVKLEDLQNVHQTDSRPR